MFAQSIIRDLSYRKIPRGYVINIGKMYKLKYILSHITTL